MPYLNTYLEASRPALFQQRLGAATTPDEAREAVADLVHHLSSGNQRELVLTHELYTLAARQPAYRELTRAWMHRSRQILEQHFTPSTARQLDALIEGLSIHRALDTSHTTAAYGGRQRSQSPDQRPLPPRHRSSECFLWHPYSGRGHRAPLFNGGIRRQAPRGIFTGVACPACGGREWVRAMSWGMRNA